MRFADKMSENRVAPVTIFSGALVARVAHMVALPNALRHCHCLIGSGAAAEHGGLNILEQNPVAQTPRPPKHSDYLSNAIYLDRTCEI